MLPVAGLLLPLLTNGSALAFGNGAIAAAVAVAACGDAVAGCDSAAALGQVCGAGGGIACQ